MAKAAAGFDLAAAEATEIPAGGKAPVDFIVGYLWILVGSSWATMLEFHIELQMPGRCEDWALHLHPRGWGNRFIAHTKDMRTLQYFAQVSEMR